jgi:Glycosyl transferase family 2
MATIPPQRAPARSSSRHRLVTPHISVVVINFCQWRNTDRLTHQLVDSAAIDAGTADVLVVDNDSPPDPALGRVRRTPGVSLRRFARNTGFARAANEGFRLAGGDWVLLLNPDTAVPEGFLDQLEGLCRTLDADEARAGVVGLSLRHADGSLQASSGPPPTLGRTLSGLFLGRSGGLRRVVLPLLRGRRLLPPGLERRLVGLVRAERAPDPFQPAPHPTGAARATLDDAACPPDVRGKILGKLAPANDCRCGVA